MDDFGFPIPAQTLEQINQQFDQGSQRMGGIERELQATRKELHELKQQLADLLEFFTAMKGAFKVLNWLAKLARPTGAIVGLGAACLTAWSAWRGIR